MASTNYQTLWNKRHTRQVHLKLNKETDADILARLEQMDNRQGYIKYLIRRDMGQPVRRVNVIHCKECAYCDGSYCSLWHKYGLGGRHYCSYASLKAGD